MNKVGVVYNLFDGEELLEHSIMSIRPLVDYITIVYQVVSNFGEHNNSSELISKKLMNKGLVDNIIKYEPEVLYLDNGETYWESGTANELVKRNVGLNDCKEVGCDYLLMMDTDEFYTSKQFSYAFNEIINGNYDTSFCQMVTYYKEPCYRLEPKETYYVPFIIKLKEDTEYKLHQNYPIRIDQTRQSKVGNCIVFDRDELEMHHYSFVRKNILKKFNNSSSVFPKEEIEDCVQNFKDFELGKRAILLGKRIYDVVETKNLFNIKI